MVFDERRGSSTAYDLDIVSLRVGSSRIVNGPEAYQAVNEIVIQKKKRETLYKKGYTLPVTAERLAAEAERTIRHSAKLARNMTVASQPRPGDAAKGAVSAHHVVAATDDQAERSRTILYGWRIGINDVDNGVFLPTYKNSVVASKGLRFI